MPSIDQTVRRSIVSAGCGRDDLEIALAGVVAGAHR
jgi:hypothetical protein